MSWVNFFDEIYVVNLTKRTDRLLQTTLDFEEYGIPFKRISAIEDANGAKGLRDTMIGIFGNAIEKGYKNILIFEDDCKIIVPPPIFNDVMDKAISQLPENYHLLFLGGQATGGFSHFHSTNLLPVTKYFATHSVAYSIQGIKEIMIRELGYPIDNWYVENIEILGHSYCTDPLLCSQYAGYSDIGKNEIDWSPFIIPRHEQKKAEMNRR